MSPEEWLASQSKQAAPAAPAATVPAASSQVATSTQTARDQEAIPILLKELEAAQVLKNAGDTRAAGDVDAIVRELALKGVKVDAIPAPAVAPAASAAVQPQPVVVRPTLGEQLIGAGETALTLLTGVTGGTVGTIAGTGTGLAQQILSGQFGTPEAVRAVERAAVEGAQALTYQPRTQAGQEQVQAVGQVLSNVLPPVLPIIAAPGQLMQAARQAAPITQATAQRSAQAVQQATARGVQSITGRAPARPPAAERPEPRLFAADALAAPTPAPAPAPATAVRGSAGAAATPEAVRRVTTAEGLRVPVTLTRGAAQRDAAQLAFEKEQMKGEFGAPLRDRVEENNLQILQNFDATIDATGAKAAFSGPSATGGSVVNALSAGWQAAKNKTRVAYTKAKNSPEAQAEVDTNLVVTIGKDELEITDSLIGYINSQITGLPSSVVPDTARKLLTKMGLADIDDAGNLIAKPATVGKLEEFRKELSGTAKFDDDVALRQETILKKLVDAQTDPVSGPLYKEARALRTKQANKYEDRAIVARLIKNRAGMKDPQVAVDKVFQRSILNGSPEEITFLKRVLLTSGKDGQQAFKELQAATVQHIRDQATSGVGTDSAGRRLVSPAKLNEIVSELDKNGRLDVIFGKQEAGRIRDLDEVVKYVTTVPPGTLINSSGTVGTLLAALAETGAVGVTTGLPVPVISGINQIIKWRKAGQTKAKINDALNALPIVKP